ncbi:MAG TPA: PilZ domain-containing protein [Thermoanaerobaculia bacterium]|nr:PilZ domain-containing protein [Thermoanaerobaculia bacterium]
MSARPEERREFQRLELREPIAGTLDGTGVRLLDLGVLGARVELSSGTVAEQSAATLRFESDGAQLAFDCAVVRLSESLSGHPEVGLRLLQALDSSDERLRQLLMKLVSEEIERARSQAPQAAAPTFDPDETAMRIPAPFLSCRFADGSWRRRGVFIPDQPDSGFTIPSGQELLEVQRLCLTYELGNGEERRLIRLFAELRICQHLGVPRRKI